jgi:hypothetical protein
VPRRPNSHVSVDVTWRGDEVQQRAHRATGRMHQYMHPAIEQARGYATHIMATAFKAEGF